jgi:hypothetical protein
MWQAASASVLKFEIYFMRFEVWETLTQFGWFSYGLLHCVVGWVVTDMLRPAYHIQTTQCYNPEDDKMSFYINKFSRLVSCSSVTCSGLDVCLSHSRYVVDCSSLIKVLTFWNLKFLSINLRILFLPHRRHIFYYKGWLVNSAREIIVIYCEKHRKYINTLCGKLVVCLNVEADGT